MATEQQEPEEKKQTIDADFNPLDAPVNEKQYGNTAGTTASAESFTKPIEEPSFNPPPIDKKPPNASGGNSSGSGGAKRAQRESFNPDMNQMPKKEAERAAAFAADLIMQLYEGVHAIANNQMQVSEKKLHKLQADGEINLNAMIQYDYGKQISAGDFFKNYNQQVSTAFTVSDDFKEKVMPLLTEILAERGIGATKEQTLLFIVAQDVAVKVVHFVTIKSQLDYMIEAIKSATVNQYAPPPPRREPPPTPPQQPTTTPAPEAETPPPTPNAEPSATKEAAKGVRPDKIIIPRDITKRSGRPKKK